MHDYSYDTHAIRCILNKQTRTTRYVAQYSSDCANALRQSAKKIAGISPRASPGLKNELMFVSVRGKPRGINLDCTSTLRQLADGNESLSTFGTVYSHFTYFV